MNQLITFGIHHAVLSLTLGVACAFYLIHKFEQKLSGNRWELPTIVVAALLGTPALMAGIAGATIQVLVR